MELPQSAREILADSSSAWQDPSAWTLNGVLQGLLAMLSDSWGGPLRFAAQAAAVLLLGCACGLLIGGGQGRNCVEAVSVLSFGALSLAAMGELLASVGQTAESCQHYLLAFIPVYSGVAAAGGQAGGAAVYSTMFLAMSNFLAGAIRAGLLPVLQIYFCFSLTAAIWNNPGMEEAAGLFARCLNFLLKGCGVLFSMVLGFQSILAGTTDSAAIRMGRSVLGGDPGGGRRGGRGADQCGGGGPAAERVAGPGGCPGVGRRLPAGFSPLHHVLSGVCRGRDRGLGQRPVPLRADLPDLFLRCPALRFGADALLFHGFFVNCAAFADRGRRMRMQTVRHLALGVCILCAGAGMIRIFWPETTFKPVINAVLLLYIIAAALPVGLAADWPGFAARLQAEQVPQQSTETGEEYRVYQDLLARQASVQAMETVFARAGIEAQIALQGEVCVIELAQEQDLPAARQLVEENGGTLEFRVLVKGGKES